jgi:hypothetical protein
MWNPRVYAAPGPLMTQGPPPGPPVDGRYQWVPDAQRREDAYQRSVMPPQGYHHGQHHPPHLHQHAHAQQVSHYASPHQQHPSSVPASPYESPNPQRPERSSPLPSPGYPPRYGSVGSYQSQPPPSRQSGPSGPPMQLPHPQEPSHPQRSYGGYSGQASAAGPPPSSRPSTLPGVAATESQQYAHGYRPAQQQTIISMRPPPQGSQRSPSSQVQLPPLHTTVGPTNPSATAVSGPGSQGSSISSQASAGSSSGAPRYHPGPPSSFDSAAHHPGERERDYGR